MSKNTTAIRRGAMLAKESLAIRKTPIVTIEAMEKGNRQQRRIAAKQRNKNDRKWPTWKS